MLLAIFALVFGLILLVWSADRFVNGASVTAKILGMPPLLVGMIVVGFGTSAPEMLVSAIAASNGNGGLALGNAYGSNITNIALIIGLVALISPINVKSQVLKRELPILLAVTLFAGWQLFDYQLTRFDAWCLISIFVAVIGWSIYQAKRHPNDAFITSSEGSQLTFKQAIMWLIVGLIVLLIASRILVFGAVFVAQSLGVSDLVIGLTIVAVGTSLPELASSLIAIKKGEHDLALGNVIGSNLFNTLMVTSIAALIQPMSIDSVFLSRDWTLMFVLTLALLIFSIGLGIKRAGRINRIEGGLFLIIFCTYTVMLLKNTV
jgi:cation:H+ antiporter